MDCTWWFLLFVVAPAYVWVARFLYVRRHSPSITWRGSPRTKEEAKERERREQEAADALRRHPWLGWVPSVTWVIVVGGVIVAAAYHKLQR
ncbi:MAG TPA: hypothetical protein VG099_30370 [Gemmataceae bacterium]|jgi:hypothetical protein|nr:hypothetical protein [Gemmataceae bacterium]